MIFQRALLALVAVFAGGCSLLAPRPGSTQWTIAVQTSVPAATGDPALADLAIARPRMAAPWNSDALVYVHENGEARRDLYNGWVMPIDQLIQAQLVDQLSQAKVAGAVVTEGLFGSDSCTLNTSVRTFGAYYAADRQGVARVRLQALLVRPAADPPQVTMDRSYEHTVPIEADNAAGVVKALSTAFGQCVRDLIRDLRALPPQAKPSP